MTHDNGKRIVDTHIYIYLNVTQMQSVISPQSQHGYQVCVCVYSEFRPCISTPHEFDLSFKEKSN